MQTDIPVPLIMKIFRRPSRSMAKKEMKLQMNFQVMAHEDRMRARSLDMLRFSSKIVDTYVEIKLPPHICWKNCSATHRQNR